MSKKPNAVLASPSNDQRSPFHEAALKLAARGLPVFPLRPRGKKPLISTDDGGHGCNDGTTNSKQIDAWWRATPDANIGLSTGPVAKVFVLDVDIGKGGTESLRALVQRHGTLPQTLKARTGTGGWHHYFRYPDGGVSNSESKIARGLDIRGAGGYVVVPPSIHPDTGEAYAWENQAAIAPAPDWLLELIDQASTVSKLPARDTAILEGQRNGALASLAGKLLREGFDLEDLISALLQINDRRCQPPLPHKEVVQIARSIARYASQGPWPQTDVGNAERLMARHGEILLYCAPWKDWLVWDGSHWKHDADGAATRLAIETARSIQDEAAAVDNSKLRDKIAQHGRRTEGQTRLDAMLKVAQVDRPVQPEELDRDPWLLNLANGTLDLKTRRLRPHDPDDRLTKLLPIAYDPKAQCPTWRRFLERITDGDPELEAFLKRIVGYSLTGDTSEQTLFVFYGTGANGKSTFLETVHALLGDYAAKAEPRTFLQRNGEAIRNDIARLRGKRFVSSAEVGRGERLDERLVKEATGGDKMTARFLRREYFEFVPEFKLVMACNHKPEIHGADEGIWRRIYAVPFSVSIPKAEQDRHLVGKLKAELPGILNWALEGLSEWQKIGLQPPAAVIKATEGYRREMDLLADFLSSDCEETSDGDVPAWELYAAYQRWCSDNGEKPVNQRRFGRMMSERGFASKVTTRRGKSVRVHPGLRLVTF